MPSSSCEPDPSFPGQCSPARPCSQAGGLPLPESIAAANERQEGKGGGHGPGLEGGGGYKQFPNALTVLRLVLAFVFFLILNFFRYPGDVASHNAWALPWAMGLFILAAITDALDGYLARRWQAESTFGRIMDPFCDKVLVIGAFIYLAGPRFVMPQAVERGDFLTMSTGVYPWMVALILARELLVTSIRGEIEGLGIKFPANIGGKLKMILQAIAIPAILLIVYLDPARPDRQWLGWVRDVLVYATVLVTLLSGWPYVKGAMQVLKQDRRKGSSSVSGNGHESR